MEVTTGGGEDDILLVWYKPRIADDEFDGAQKSPEAAVGDLTEDEATEAASSSGLAMGIGVAAPLLSGCAFREFLAKFLSSLAWVLPGLSA